MVPRVSFLFIFSLFVLPVLSADQSSMVRLENESLNIRQLVEEAGRQTGVDITIDLKEDNGPTLPYDCESSLREILDGVRGYFFHRTGLELLETWDGEKKVHLHFKAMETEIIAVQIEGKAPVPAPKKVVKEKSSKKPGFFGSLFGRKGPGVKEQRKAEEPMAKTEIKHMDLSEKEEEPEDHPLEEVPETIPTRLIIEPLKTDSFQVSPKESEKSVKLDQVSPKDSKSKPKPVEEQSQPEEPQVEELEALDLEPISSVNLESLDEAKAPKAATIQMKEEKKKPSTVNSLPDL